MDGIQTLLVIVVITLTALLIIIGYQVLRVILDLRRALKRINSLLDDSILGGGLLRPDRLTSVVEFFRNKGWQRHGDSNGQY
jgi:hypothetical protein